MHRNNLNILLAAILFFIGILMLRQGMALVRESLLTTNLYLYERFVAYGSTDATILSIRSVPHEQAGYREVYATYRYQVEVPGRGLTRYEAEDRIDGGMLEISNAHVGDVVSIKYVLEQPGISEIVGTNAKVKEFYLQDKYAGPLIIYFCGGSILLFVSAGGIIYSWRKQRNLKRKAALQALLDNPH
jgi:hypothetical protein